MRCVNIILSSQDFQELQNQKFICHGFVKPSSNFGFLCICCKFVMAIGKEGTFAVLGAEVTAKYYESSSVALQFCKLFFVSDFICSRK